MPNGELLLCEGEADALAACSCGARQGVVSVPGVGFPVERLANAVYGLGVRRVVLAFDADTAGDTFTAKVAPALAQTGVEVRRLRLERECDLAETLASLDPDERPAWLLESVNGAPPVEETDPEVDAICRALFVDAQDTRSAEGAPREAVPGTGGLLHRGVAAILFGERGGGKSTVALAVAMGAAHAGETVLYLDRENGAQLTSQRVEAFLDAHEDWPNPLDSGRLMGRHYPDVGEWKPHKVGKAMARFGVTGVVYDSVREFLAQLGLDPDREKEVSRFFAMAVTPLLRRGLFVVLLDNVGHEEKGRPKGSGTKLDAIPQAYKVATTAPFSPTQPGAVRITCTRSRYGDVDREWTMRVGGGAFDVPAAADEAPDGRQARQAGEARETFLRACLAVLAETSPLPLRDLVEAARRRGAKGRNAKLRDWAAELASDPASGMEQDGAGGYRLWLEDASRARPGEATMLSRAPTVGAQRGTAGHRPKNPPCPRAPTP